MVMLIKTLPWHFGVDDSSNESDEKKSKTFGFTFLEDHVGKLSQSEDQTLYDYMTNSQIARAWMGMR